LLPENLYIELFPGQCRVRRGGKSDLQVGLCPATSDPETLVAHLQQILDALTPKIGKGARLRIAVSDSIASIVTMPWQERLHGSAEIANYARICFDKQGMTVDEKSVLHAEYRQHGGTGIAYALPRVWMQALIDVIEAKQCRLSTVLPISAAAYFRYPLSKNEGARLLLLEETNRISALGFGRSGLLSYEVEAYTHSTNASQQRLLRRIAAADCVVSSIHHWSSTATNNLPDITCLVDGKNNPVIENMQKQIWL